MAWSSYAHLPTTEDEYFYILSHLKNGMSNQEVDSVIAKYKKKEKVQHHYRSNLAKIGFFDIEKNSITLNYDAKKLSKDKKHLKFILNSALTKNQSIEIKEVYTAVTITQSYDLQDIVNILQVKYPSIERNNFVRWIRPIISLIKIVDILSINPVRKSPYVKFLQEAFFKTNTLLGSPAPLELVETELKKIDVSLNIVILLDKVLEDFNLRFKIELLMMPSWATKNRSYKIGEDMYTHIKIKSNLLKEDE